jgi:hypothetical protein
VDNPGWVATARGVNQADKKLEDCSSESVEWAGRRELWFDTAKTEAKPFRRRRDHKKHLRLTLTAKIKVENTVLGFNQEVTLWLGVWMDAHLKFKELHNRWLKKARAADARLCTLTRMHGIVAIQITAVQIAWVQAVALYGSKLRWDPKGIGRREDLQLLFNRQARSTLGVLPMTPLGAPMRKSGLTPAPVALDSRQEQFTARLATVCEGSKLTEMHDHPMSDVQICRITKDTTKDIRNAR